MSRNINAAHEAQYQGENVREILFVYMDFSSGITRVHNAVGDISWGGNTYEGVGDLGGISVLEEGVEIRPLRIKLTLTGVDPTMLSRIVDEQYHGRDVKIYRGTCDANYALAADPDLIWSGFMDHATVALTQGMGAIELVCENQMARWDVARAQRYTDADQQKRFPGDLFFEYLPQLAEYEVDWGGKKIKPYRQAGGPDIYDDLNPPADDSDPDLVI